MPANILINHLVVVGTNKNYKVDFNPGVNIIYGDSATGKSGILNLIDYLLGARKFKLYPEIEAVARYAMLDVTLNEDRYTIKRNIFDASKPIEVFPSGYCEVDKHIPKKYLPNFNKNSRYPELEFYSDFLFDALNLRSVKIKVSPSKDASKLTQLSFRDLFRYCYIDQDDLGSKSFLKPPDYSLKAKFGEVFKYIFNTLDSTLTSLEAQISDKSRQRQKLESKFQTVSEFLRDSNFGSLPSFDAQIGVIDEELDDLKKQIDKLNKTQTADVELYSSIKTNLSEISLQKSSLAQELHDLQVKIVRYTRLKNDYVNDISKFKSSLAAREFIGEVSKDATLCPVCDNNVEIDTALKKFNINPDERINYEINSLKRRARDAETLLRDTRMEWEKCNQRIQELDIAERKARRLIDENTKSLSSSYLAERDMYINQFGELTQKRKDLVDRLKVRNQHSHLTDRIKSLDSQIEALKEQLEELRQTAPSMADVLSNLADNLLDYLSFVRIQSPTGVSIDERSFMPKLRGIEYENVTSGGLRTILGIGYLCSFMREALNSKINHPSFLMIDTVGKYLGKTSSRVQEDSISIANSEDNEAVADPEKYQNVYEYIIELASAYQEKSRTCQFILVDNDVPDHIVEELSGFIVAHYSSDRSDNLPIGFIDDADYNY